MEEQVDESYDPTADFFQAAPHATPMYQPEYPQIDVVSAVPIPEGAVAQGEAIDIEMPHHVEAAAAAEGASAADGEGTSAGAPGMLCRSRMSPFHVCFCRSLQPLIDNYDRQSAG